MMARKSSLMERRIARQSQWFLACYRQSLGGWRGRSLLWSLLIFAVFVIWGLCFARSGCASRNCVLSSTCRSWLVVMRGMECCNWGSLRSVVESRFDIGSCRRLQFRERDKMLLTFSGTITRFKRSFAYLLPSIGIWLYAMMFFECLWLFRRWFYGAAVAKEG